MEPPECPVCLQPFSADAAVPRVLSCGHSACEPCLSLLSSLPSPFPDSIRCPSCTQLVRFSRSLGPSSLPKNIDLLRILPSSPSPSPTPALYNPPPPLLRFAAPHPLTALWSPFVLPSSPSPSPRHRLHPLRSSPSADGEFRPSYLERVARELDRMPPGDRDALRSILRAAARRGVSRVLGLWMDDAGVLCLVVKSPAAELSDVLAKTGKGAVGVGMLGMEMCEAVVGLHGDGIVCGCLAVECFGLDEWGHCVIDVGRVFLVGRQAREVTDGTRNGNGPVFVSPEAIRAMGERKDDAVGDGFDVGCGSDVWSLAGVLAFVVARWFGCGSDEDEGFGLHEDLGCVWMKKMVSAVESSSVSARFEHLVQIIGLCLSHDPVVRPSVMELWRCMRELFIDPGDDPVPYADLGVPEANESGFNCLLLCGLCAGLNRAGNTSRGCAGDLSVADQLVPKEAGSELAAMDEKQIGVSNDMLNTDGLKSTALPGHRDCITGLTVGGNFLFSSSFDKTIHVWSLKDFSLCWTLKGHEHRVMAILALETEEEQVLCISADSGGFIFVWNIGCSTGHALLRQWREHNDWLYSGVYSLAALGSQYLYSGSGDKSIKAWTLQDYSLSCTMIGHTSTVSSLVVAQGILYSGSWDGTVRLWWLDNHSPLIVLGNDSPGKGFSVLSLAVDGEMLIASYENGHVKVWKNDTIVWSDQNHSGAIFALQVRGKQFLSGGWDKMIKVQELIANEDNVELRSVGDISCNSVITCLLSDGKRLFAGLSNGEVKVYYYPSS